MTTPLADVLAAVPSLNQPGEPFAFAAEGDTIVGSWDIVKATSLYPTELTSIDRDYRITVTFDIAKDTYDFNEVHTATTTSVDADSAGFQKSFFSGKTSSKEFSFELGGINKTDDGVSIKPVAYSFSTKRIKEPLFTFLEQHGWRRRKGLLGGLFNR
ncbi:hypothetical protein [Aeromicrobium sp. NPDC092404]|uniref:hypothetical protein n=1 Tax=Aeromicrobium sp. NPDC092404 TaxID=3154976 RepID=UPI003418F078